MALLASKLVHKGSWEGERRKSGGGSCLTSMESAILNHVHIYFLQKIPGDRCGITQIYVTGVFFVNSI